MTLHSALVALRWCNDLARQFSLHLVCTIIFSAAKIHFVGHVRHTFLEYHFSPFLEQEHNHFSGEVLSRVYFKT